MLIFALQSQTPSSQLMHSLLTGKLMTPEAIRGVDGLEEAAALINLSVDSPGWDALHDKVQPQLTECAMG